MRKILILFLLLLLFSSCYHYKVRPTPQGTISQISIKGYKKINAELLFMTDDSLFIKKDQKLIAVCFDSVKKIHLSKFDSDADLIAGMLLVSNVVLSAWAQSVGFDKFWINGPKIGAAICLVELVRSTRGINYRAPWDNKKLNRIQPYCRYSGGLSNMHRKDLLSFHNQTKFHSLDKL